MSTRTIRRVVRAFGDAVETDLADCGPGGMPELADDEITSRIKSSVEDLERAIARLRELEAASTPAGDGRLAIVRGDVRTSIVAIGGFATIAANTFVVIPSATSHKKERA